MKKQYTPEEIKELRSNYTTLDTSKISTFLEDNQYQSRLEEFLHKNPSANEKRFVEYQIKVLEKVLEEYYETADLYDGEELDGKELINGVLITTKTGTASDYWQFMDELDLFKDKLQELTQPKQIRPTAKDEENETHFPFLNAGIYNKFIEFAKSIKETDYLKSYANLKKNLEADKFINKQTDNEFMFFVYNNLNLITKEQHTEYLQIGQLESAERTKGKNRKADYERVFKNV